MIDLHMHTNHSDGQFSPTETVRIAAEAGVTAMSITDHDTASATVEAARAAASYGICFFSGIEISVQGENELHILGYGIDPENEALQSFCRHNAEERRARSLRLIRYLTRCGIPITLEDVRRYNDGNCSGRPHFAKTLVNLGFADSVQDAFTRYLTTPEYYADVERPKPTPEEGIRVIREAGGIAVLAHPHQLKMDNIALEKLIAGLRKCGLSGIEAYYSLHTKEQTALYLHLAEKYRLLITCGSDFHGPAVKPDIQAGTGRHGSLGISDEKLILRLQQALHRNK